MTFGRWYPLPEAAARAPARAGVLQLRVAEGLVDYPRGKSAMVHYQAATNMADTAGDLARRFAGEVLWCRHTEELSPGEARDVVAACGALVDRFKARFGAEPRLPR